jgi:hypothetical protein
MKASAIALALAVLATCALPSVFAQQGVVFNYTIHVDFFAYACTLSVAQVSLFDSSGSLVGAASSPGAGEVEILLRTSVPMSTLTATAYGLATYGSYSSWSVNGSGSITLGSIGDYWITIRMG